MLAPTHPDHALWQARLVQVTGLPVPDLVDRMLGQLINLDPRADDDTAAAANAALEGLAALAPRDAAESFLAAQMLATYQAAMDCYRRGLFPDQTLAARDLYLKHAAKLSRLYADQLLALAKYRNRGQQTVRVEHVTVNGNAIVGAVQARGDGATGETEGQPHAQQDPALLAGPGIPVWRTDASGDHLPAASHDKRAMSATRR